MQWALDVVCEYSGWPIGHVYLVDLVTGNATSSGIWNRALPGTASSFRALTDATPMAAGIGLPGRIVAGGQPAWVEDVGADLELPRAQVAVACGIRAAFAFPVVTVRGVEGVMEFFAAEPMAKDDQLLDLLAHVGHELGGALDRSRADETLRTSEARLREAQRIARAGWWSWQIGADVVTWSDELFEIYGLEPTGEPVTFERYLERVHPDDHARVLAAVRSVTAGGETVEHDYRIVRPDGETRWMHAQVQVSARDGAVATRLTGFCQDVTAAREQRQRRLQAQRDLASHQRILDRIAHGEPLETTLDSICREIEGRYPGTACSVLLADLAEGRLHHGAAPSLPAAFVEAIDGLPIAEGSGACGTAAATGETVIVEDAMTHPATALFVESARQHQLRAVWSHPLLAPDGTTLGTFAVYRHRAERPSASEIGTVMAAGSLAALAIDRNRSEHALVSAARLDPLTGLPNRAWFVAQLGQLLAGGGRPVAVMYLGLDGLRAVSESLGHAEGDRVVVDVAARIRCVLGDDPLLARFGDDSFVVACEDADASAALAERLEAAFVAPFELDGGEFFLSVSIGIAADAHGDAAALLRDADIAMSAARQRGRGGHAVFDAGLLERSTARLSLEADLRRAIERDEFVMHYQPVVDLHRRKWAGVEALVRWEHPTRGWVPPDEFIPLAEETGLIVPLGLLILDHTIGQLAAWVAQGRDVTVSANLSVVQLSAPGVASEILTRLDRGSVPHERFVVEVTETAVMAQLDVAREALEELNDAGVTIEIDDFGTGYSSIARLGDLPVAGIKIDRRFTASVCTGLTGERTVGAITDLAHALDMTVVAEGIETAGELAKAHMLGCDFGQGWFFAKAMTAAEVTAVLDTPPQWPATMNGKRGS
jgi:c-di-GMP-specific phosphodiesterase